MTRKEWKGQKEEEEEEEEEEMVSMFKDYQFDSLCKRRVYVRGELRLRLTLRFLRQSMEHVMNIQRVDEK